MYELLRALAVYAEPPGPSHPTVAQALGLAAPSAADFAETFLFAYYPYASVYLGPEGKLGGVARDRVAGLWRALGEAPPKEPDHLCALLGGLASLDERASEASDPRAQAAWTEARRTLLEEHLLSWAPLYAWHLSQRGPLAYQGWANLLGEALAAAAPPEAPPTLPQHLREAPPPLEAGPELSLQELLEHLLSPLQSGALLLRADLQQIARAVGFGLRKGERRFALEALLGQAPAEVLAALSAHFAAQAAALPPGPRPLISAWWRQRARGSAALLEALAGQALDHPLFEAPQAAAPAP